MEIYRVEVAKRKRIDKSGWIGDYIQRGEVCLTWYDKYGDYVGSMNREAGIEMLKRVLKELKNKKGSKQ